MGQRQLFDTHSIQACQGGTCETLYNVKDRHMDQCLTNQWVGSKRSESSERFNLLTETCRKHGSFEYKGEQQCRFVLARTSAAAAQTSH